MNEIRCVGVYVTATATKKLCYILTKCCTKVLQRRISVVFVIGQIASTVTKWLAF